MALQKLAFLFLTVSNIYHEHCWLTFFKGHENEYSLYIHSKEPLKSSAFKHHELLRKIPTTWENTMRAQIELLRVALQDPYNYKFIFASDTTIPLQTFSYVYNTLMQHPYSQFDFYFYPNQHKNLQVIPERKRRRGTQWIVLNRKHAELMVKDTTYITIFDTVPCDNEQYPATLLALQELEHEIIKYDTLFVLWPGNRVHPHTFTDLKNDKYFHWLVDAITHKKYLFARKFASTCDLSPLASYRPELFG
jgi:hypothetical protein